MGRRQGSALGLTLSFDQPLFGPALRRDALPMRLVLPGPLGTPDWHVGTGLNRVHEAKHHDVHTARTALQKFKDALLQKQIDARKPRKAILGLPADQLRALADFDAFKLRTDVADRFDEMSKAMLTEYKARPNQKPGESIGIASTYRNADDDARAWEKAFKKHFGRTEKQREETGDPLGKEALNMLFHVLNGKKAPPGFSGHTHGIAADMTTNQFGTTWTTNSDYDHQVGWQKTWLYDWLVRRAAEFDFYQLKTETWHWEYHAEEPGKRDQCYGGKVPINGRKVAKPT